jgi:Acetylornithine deacetylase/Succinyl-diaminopimelate desuccinylase and related deacylases
MTDAVELTRELVAIPSHEDETAASDAIEAWLREHTSATVTRDEHGSVFARRGGTDQLALVGHHDVVPPDPAQLAGEDDSGYTVERRGGRLYGRGTADMKGAVAAAMCAFRDTDQPGVTFVSFVGEEQGGVGARAAIEDGFAPEYAVVGEGSTGYSGPGVTDVAVAHRGRRASTIRARGEAAHASEPEAGTNAVYRASDAIDEIQELPAPETTVLGHDVTGSLVATEIAGGSAWNVIPESCTITIDERTVPDGRAPLARITEQPGIEWTVDQDLPPMACDEPAFADRVRAAAADAQSDEPTEVIKPHATDAGWLAQAGTTCMVCGPAERGEAHTADESVSIEAVERAYRIYRELAADPPGI